MVSVSDLDSTKPEAAALAAFREDDWVGQIGNGLAAVSVAVQQPAVEHHVRVKDFLAWLTKEERRFACRGRAQREARENVGVSPIASTRAHSRGQ
jgi:hypothetical protein